MFRSIAAKFRRLRSFLFGPSKHRPIVKRPRLFVEQLEVRLAPAIAAESFTLTTLHDQSASVSLVNHVTGAAETPTIEMQNYAQGYAIITNGELFYMPPAHFAGTESLVYVASDSTGSAAGTVTLIVTNQVQTITGHELTVAHGQTIANIDLLAGATDADGDALQISYYGSPTHGYLAPNGNGTFDYWAPTNWGGTETFNVVANDGVADSAPAALTITVIGPPTAADLYQTYLATVAQADQVYEDAVAAAVAAERSADAEIDADQTQAGELLDAAFQSTLNSLEAANEAALTAAESAYNAAVGAAQTAKDARVAAAEAVFISAAEDADNTRDQAVQAAASEYAEALTDADGVYEDSLSPYLQARDGAAAFLADHPEDPAAQAALADAEQALSDAQAQAAPIRAAAYADALADKQTAEQDAEASRQSSLDAAGNDLLDECAAAEEEFEDADYAAWAAEVQADDTAQDTFEEGEQFTSDDHDADLQNLEDQRDAAESGAAGQRESAERTADNTWKGSEQTAWNTYNEGLSSLSGAPAAETRRDPPGKDGTPIFAVPVGFVDSDNTTHQTCTETATGPMWYALASPYYASYRTDAKYRAWLIAHHNGATDDSAVGPDVAAAFADLLFADTGDNIIPTASTTWSEFFPQGQYDQYIAIRRREANELDLAVLLALDADWQVARRQTGYNNASSIGEAVAQTWRQRAGFGSFQPQSGWQQLYTNEAYLRLQALRAANTADPAQMNAVDVAELESAVRTGGDNAITRTAAQRLVLVVVNNPAPLSARQRTMRSLICMTSSLAPLHGLANTRRSSYRKCRRPPGINSLPG